MKTIYQTEIYFSFILNHKGKQEEYYTHYTTYKTYNYGELPETETKEFNNPDTVFKDLLKILGYSNSYTGHKTLFRKRQYIDEYDFDRYIYKDELVSFKVITKYIPYKYLSVETLQKRLTFEDYSQLVFDREQELKYELLFNKEN